MVTRENDLLLSSPRAVPAAPLNLKWKLFRLTPTHNNMKVTNNAARIVLLTRFVNLKHVGDITTFIN
jgi:hypothetical protein